MSYVFQKGDIVRIAQLPSNYAPDIKDYLGLELKISKVQLPHYHLKLEKPVTVDGQEITDIPVHFAWVEAILTVEAL